MLKLGFPFILTDVSFFSQCLFAWTETQGGPSLCHKLMLLFFWITPVNYFRNKCPWLPWNVGFSADKSMHLTRNPKVGFMFPQPGSRCVPRRTRLHCVWNITASHSQCPGQPLHLSAIVSLSYCSHHSLHPSITGILFSKVGVESLETSSISLSFVNLFLFLFQRDPSVVGWTQSM